MPDHADADAECNAIRDAVRDTDGRAFGDADAVGHPDAFNDAAANTIGNANTICDSDAIAITYTTQRNFLWRWRNGDDGGILSSGILRSRGLYLLHSSTKCRLRIAVGCHVRCMAVI